jgi:hypothetical protein
MMPNPEEWGRLLDRALDDLGLTFQPQWDPIVSERHRRRRWHRVTWASAGLAAGVLAAPLAMPLPVNHTASGFPHLAAVHLSASERHVLTLLHAQHVQVQDMTPVYTRYPVVAPSGHAVVIQGQFYWGAVIADHMSLDVNNREQVQGGVLFQQGTPVYAFSGSSPVDGHAISLPGHVRPADGMWYQEGNVGLTAFSAAGSHVYITHGKTWADLVGHRKEYWIKDPGHLAGVTHAVVAGLPDAPEHALLLEQLPSTLSIGYLTDNGGKSWRRWSLGTQDVSDLIGMGSYYWAIFNGTLARSPNGTSWQPLLRLNARVWQVQSYAVNPQNPNMIAVALIPAAGQGIGPVLETTDGGQNWRTVPGFPVIGRPPSQMAMSPNGVITGLINEDGPMVVEYLPRQRTWRIVPVPSNQRDNQGLGQLAASPNGDLWYGAPNGTIFQWVAAQNRWFVVAPPSGVDPDGEPAMPLQAIGNHQVLASYPSSWFIFWEPKQMLKTPPTSAIHAHVTADEGMAF